MQNYKLATKEENNLKGDSNFHRREHSEIEW